MKDYSTLENNGVKAVRCVGSKNNRRVWEFKCFCGKLFVTVPRNVEIGHTRSCGCVTPEKFNHAADRDTRSPLEQATYYAYRAMINRCTNTEHESYVHYGERGISVCPEWLNSFDKFKADVGIKPSWEHSLDRIDNDGNYEPNNCRWATRSQQNKNKRYISRGLKRLLNNHTNNL